MKRAFLVALYFDLTAVSLFAALWFIGAAISLGADNAAWLLLLLFAPFAFICAFMAAVKLLEALDPET